MKNDKREPTAAPARTKKKPTAAEKLAAAAQAAADVRAYDTNPDVIAYRIERMRARVDRLMWAGVVIGLAFTAANVQQFAARDAEPWSIPWCIAWLLDPTVSLILLGTLLGEQVIARHQIKAGPWIRRTKWIALLLTYLMNTWSSWQAKDPAAILLHSVPPAIVFCAAEAITTLKHQITEAVHKAYETAAVRARAAAPAPVRTAPLRRSLVFRTAPRTEGPRVVRIARTFAFRTGPVIEPVRVLRRAFTFQPGARTARTEHPPAPAPAPVDLPVEKEAFVRTLREEILAAAERGDRWGPDYEALMTRTRRSRSWVEKRVREARMQVFRTGEAAA
ncbi:hypothetical protein [Nonomuraea lactucae]|uniref:hypothetical protein n=1 Tax=Nonomuraea lactucae TaxID=2249762 RepID=UPI000DE3147E|nr:hypothetical protein [Nonomuraea lactucae]